MNSFFMIFEQSAAAFSRTGGQVEGLRVKQPVVVEGGNYRCVNNLLSEY